MRLAELRHSFALPPLPRILWRCGHRLVIVFNDGDVVAVTCEQERGAETAYPTAKDQNRHS